MAKRKIKDLNPVGLKPYGVYSRFEEYFNLLMNAVKVVSAQGSEALNYEQETFLKRGLFETDQWATIKLLNNGIMFMDKA